MTTASATIDPTELDGVFRSCLFAEHEIPDGEPPEDAVVVEGITSGYGLHSVRVKEATARVRSWLGMLPDKFRPEEEGGEGGGSFLDLCEDRNGHQWTGLHAIMEQLCVLAIACGLGKWLAPRRAWSVLPGGMPYIVFELGE
jgi:hypothetical protein